MQGKIVLLLGAASFAAAQVVVTDVNTVESSVSMEVPLVTNIDVPTTVVQTDVQTIPIETVSSDITSVIPTEVLVAPSGLDISTDAEGNTVVVTTGTTETTATMDGTTTAMTTTDAGTAAASDPAVTSAAEEENAGPMITAAPMLGAAALAALGYLI